MWRHRQSPITDHESPMRKEPPMAQILVRRQSLGILVCALAVMATPAAAQLAVRPEMRSLPKVAPTIASTAQGELHGTVVDERGEPLAGAIVSALGSATVFA